MGKYLIFNCRKSFTVHSTSFTLKAFSDQALSPLSRIPHCCLATKCAPFLSFAVTVRFLLPVTDYNQGELLPPPLKEFILLLIVVSNLY